MVGVYKITSPSGRVYIGSSKNIKRRFVFYKNLRCKQQKLLYNSFVKYGVENHLFETVCECDIADLRKMEGEYGLKYDVLNNKHGLNLRLPKSNEKYEVLSKSARKNISIGVLKSYDRRGRVTDDPEYHSKRLAKRRVRENKKYQERKAVPKEKHFTNRSNASRTGWYNPNRKVKRLTEDQRKAAKRKIQIEYRAKIKAGLVIPNKALS